MNDTTARRPAGAELDATSIPPIERPEAPRLATAEYARMVDVLRDLDGDDWEAHVPDTPRWNVRQLVAHLVGAAESYRLRELFRQIRVGRSVAKELGGALVDGINEVQVRDRNDLAPAELIARLEAAAPRFVGFRARRSPLRLLPADAPPAGRITLGYLFDVIYTRDVWMHRVDLARAVRRDLVLTADHDGRIVADVVREWAARHGRPFHLRLTGPAGGSYRQGTGGGEIEMDAVEFARTLSGRAPGDGLLTTPVPF